MKVVRALLPGALKTMASRSMKSGHFDVVHKRAISLRISIDEGMKW